MGENHNEITMDFKNTFIYLIGLTSSYAYGMYNICDILCVCLQEDMIFMAY